MTPSHQLQTTPEILQITFNARHKNLWHLLDCNKTSISKSNIWYHTRNKIYKIHL